MKKIWILPDKLKVVFDEMQECKPISARTLDGSVEIVEVVAMSGARSFVVDDYCVTTYFELLKR